MYFEEYKIGKVFDKEIEPISFTEDEIIENAKKYDPRDIHIDKQRAKKSRFGGIIASGTFSISAFWGQWVKTKIDEEGLVVGAWVDGAKWIKPVYPDTLYDIKVEIVDKRARVEGKDGFVTYKLTATNPDNEKVLEYTATALVNFRSK